MLKMKSALIGLVLVGVLGLLSGQASAGIIVLQLNHCFSGTPPQGSTPWVTVTLNDEVVANGVRMTISASGLTGSEFISEISFNTNLTVSGLTFTRIGTSPPGDAQLVTDSKKLKADGDGTFDFMFEWPGSDHTFTGGRSYVVDITKSNDVVTNDNFKFKSEGGDEGTGNYYAAAHIQSIGPSKESGWIGNSLGGEWKEIPEAGTLALWGLGCLGLLVMGRRRRK